MTQRRYIAAASSDEAMLRLRDRYRNHVHDSQDAADRDARNQCADGWPGTRVWVAEIRPAEED